MKNLKTVCILLVTITFFSCSDDDEPIVNQAPESFNLIALADGATNTSIIPTFSWSEAIDPNGNTVSYSLLLDTNPNPSTVFANNLAVANYTTTESLSLLTQYYWKVIATDSYGAATESNTFNFITHSISAQLVTANAGFSGRSGHQAVSFNNKLWVIGGADGSNKNDVWSSSDGISWTEETANAEFSARNLHQSVSFNNKLWVIGGNDDDDRKNDVWSSSDGISWTEQTANAGFSARAAHQVVSFNNKLWVIGGKVNGVSNNFQKDVWSSSDGINWTQETANASFSARYSHQAVSFNNKLWVIGGYDGSNKNDVWSSVDGINWTQETTNAGFSARVVHQAVSFNNQLWVIGGSDGSFGSNKNDVWSSVDGISWTEQTNSAAFSARSFHQVVSFNNQLWVIGGYDGSNKNDVWSMD
ncbi:MAG: hypothetical protein QM478_11045 [Flavobacteriaceae bacterium]